MIGSGSEPHLVLRISWPLNFAQEWYCIQNMSMDLSFQEKIQYFVVKIIGKTPVSFFFGTPCIILCWSTPVSLWQIFSQNIHIEFASLTIRRKILWKLWREGPTWWLAMTVMSAILYCQNPNLTSTQRLGLTWKWLCKPHPTHTDFSGTSRRARELKFGTDTH